MNLDKKWRAPRAQGPKPQRGGGTHPPVAATPPLLPPATTTPPLPLLRRRRRPPELPPRRRRPPELPAAAPPPGPPGPPGPHMASAVIFCAVKFCATDVAFTSAHVCAAPPRKPGGDARPGASAAKTSRPPTMRDTIAKVPSGRPRPGAKGCVRKGRGRSQKQPEAK